MDTTKPNKDLNELNPEFKKKIEARLKEVGDIIFVVEGYRPQERQNYLYASGRTREGQIVTQTLTSNHTGRNAVDIGFKGTTLYPPKSDLRWRQIADKAKKYGIEWGGDRETFRDNPHFENGKSLSITNILMAFYKDIRVKEVSIVPPDQRIFKDPQNAFEKIKLLSEDEKLSEILHLIGLLTQRLKK